MKKIISTAIAGLMLFSATTCLASDINITIDNELFVPKNALGEVVEPFIANGSTFLPVRAMGEAVGKEVSFDAENNAVYIGTRPMADDVKRVPYALVGNNVYYEDELAYFGNIESLAEAEKIRALAEEKFNRDDINMMQIALLAELASSGESFELEKGMQTYTYIVSCVQMLMNNVEIDEAVYKDYVTVKHVLVDDEETAKKVIKELEDGEEIGKLIEEYNTDPGQTKDSSYTFTYNEMVKEFEDAAFKLTEGEFTKEPVATDYGYHVILKLELKKDAVDLSKMAQSAVQKMIDEKEIGTVVEMKGDFYGVIDGITITNEDLDFMFGTDNLASVKFETMKLLVAATEYMANDELFKESREEHKEELRYELGLEEIEDKEKAEFLLDMSATYSTLMRAVYSDEISDETMQKIEEMTKELESMVFRDIRVFVDGKLIVPCDVNKSYVKPENIEGTVFVPVRAIVEALGMKADWDNDTRTVVISK